MQVTLRPSDFELLAVLSGVMHSMYLWSAASALGVPELILLGLTLSLCGSLGKFIPEKLGVRFEGGGLERSVFTVSLGLGMIAYATFFLGCLQLYRPFLFKLLFGVAVIVHVPRWIRTARRGAQSFRCAQKSLAPSSIVAALLAIGFGGCCLMAALGPETGFDALNYHLGIPRLFIADGGVGPLPHLLQSNFPLTVEMLYTFGWLLHSELLAKLYHFAFGLLVFGGLVAFGQRFFSVSVGLWAGLIFLASPIVAYLSQTAYVTFALTLFTFLSLYSFYVWIDTKGEGWLGLAGIYSGLALGTKYTGFSVVILITLIGAGVHIYKWFKGARPNLNPRDILLSYYTPVSLLALPWVIKNIAFTGNPMAPFFSNWIENPHLQASDYNVLIENLRNWGSFDGGWWDILRGPWLLTQYSDTFEGSPGVIFLLFFPAAALWGWRNQALRFLTICSILGYCLQILGTKQVRFYVPLFPLLSLVIAGVLLSNASNSLPRVLRYGRSLAMVLLTGLIVYQLPFFSPLWTGHRVHTLDAEAIRLFTSEEQRMAFREQKLPGEGTVELHRFLDQHVPSGGAVLALTLGYQALVGRRLELAPNNTLATRLTRRFLEAALSAGGFARLQLVVPETIQSRRWRIHVSELDLLGWQSYRPRAFSNDAGEVLEHLVLKVQDIETPDGSVLELDLGAPRSVSELVLWERPDGRQWRNLPISLSAGSGAGWKDVSFHLRVREPELSNVEELATACEKLRVTHLFFNSRRARLEFVSEFFELPLVEKYFSRVNVIGDFHVYRVQKEERP